MERTGMDKKVDGEMNADDKEEREHFPTLLGLQIWGWWKWWCGGKEKNGWMEG